MTGRTLDGVAVVSAVMASTRPFIAAEGLSKVVKAFLSSPPLLSAPNTQSLHAEGIVKAVASLLSKLREKGPVIHQVRVYSS